MTKIAFDMRTMEQRITAKFGEERAEMLKTGAVRMGTPFIFSGTTTGRRAAINPMMHQHLVFEHTLTKSGAVVLETEAKFVVRGGSPYVIELAVFAIGGYGNPTTRGQNARQAKRLMEACDVPACTPRAEQQQRLQFMLDIVSLRLEKDYALRSPIATRKPMDRPSLKIRGLGLDLLVTDDILKENMNGI